ncbi:MAG: DUF3572 domain-containing protein [Pararhizobium sp.]
MPKRPADETSRIDDESLAVSILTWLAGEPEMMGRFLSLSGLTADGLRRASREPGFLPGLVAFLTGHEPTLLAFCEATGTAPEAVAAAGRRLAAAEGDLP